MRSCTRETDTVAPLGGDEFALLQSVEGNQREAAVALAARLLDAINAPKRSMYFRGVNPKLRLPSRREFLSPAIRKSDDRKYWPCNSFRLFEPEMDAEARLRHSLQIDLRASMGRDEFEILYQTVFDAATQRRGRRGRWRLWCAGVIRRAGLSSRTSSSRLSRKLA